MATKVSRKRNRCELDLDSRVTKKARLICTTIYNVPDEILLPILAKVSKKYLGAISEVCRKWLQITETRYFWKLSCQQKWPNMVASDSTNFDINNYMIPTLIVQGETMIDWKAYWYLRRKFILVTKMTSLVPANTSYELLHSDINHFMKSFLSSSYFSLPAEVLHAAFDFICDLAFVLFDRKDTSGVNSALEIMQKTLINSHEANQIGYLRFCKRVLHLCHLIKDYNSKWTFKLITVANLLLRAVSVFDDRFKELLRSTTHFLINMATLDLDQKKDPLQDLSFQYPTPKWGCFELSFHPRLSNHKELVDIILNIASNTYLKSDDTRVRSSALCVGWLEDCTHQGYVQKYYIMAMHAVNRSDPDLYYAGLIGVAKVASIKIEVLKVSLSAQQLKNMFVVLSNAISRSNITFKALLYYLTIRMATTFNCKIITDKELDDFISRVLQMFSEITKWRQHELQAVYRIDKLGSLFAKRLADKMDALQSALFELAKSGKIESNEQMLEGYIKLGMKVEGAAFKKKFAELTNQITTVDLPFTVSVLKCYERFGYLWARVIGPEEQRQIIRTLLRSIPDGVYQLGQQRNESYIELTGGPDNFPRTWTELQKDRNDIQKIDCIGKLDKAPFHMSRYDIKPIIDDKVNHKLGSPQILRNAKICTAQLLKTIQFPRFNGMHVHYAQEVLHAALACLHLDYDNDGYLTVVDLLSYVKEEMKPSELIKYVDIIFNRLQEKQQQVGGAKAQKDFLLLFRYCLSVLHSIPEHSNVVILMNAINICIGTEKFVTPLFAELSELIYYFITNWPRFAHQAIKMSKLGQWLIKQLTSESAVPQEKLTSLLMVFAIVAGLYGIEYVLEALCIDPVEHRYYSHESYLEMVVPHCQVLYKAVRRGNVKISPLHHKYLRRFLILNAIYRVDSYGGTIAAIPKQNVHNITTLQDAIASDNFDTGVPKLNKLVKSLDLDGLCRELCLQRAKEDYDDNESKNIDSEDDMFFRVR